MPTPDDNNHIDQGMSDIVDDDGAGEWNDARTLAVEYDAQGKRHKDWRNVCGESTLEHYPDFPVSGP